MLFGGGMGGTGSEWIACDECGKWRQAAVGDVARGPWTCSINLDPRCCYIKSDSKRHLRCIVSDTEGVGECRYVPAKAQGLLMSTHRAVCAAGSTHARCRRR